MYEENEEDIEERDFTEEETQEQIRENEDSLLQNLLAAADYASNETALLEIVRNGKLYFSFHVRPMSEDKIFQIRKKYTKYSKNRKVGIRQAEDLDVAKFRCSVIYNATTEEDQAKIWDNKKLWEGLQEQGHVIVNALDVIETILLPGEKDRIMDEIDRLSGYSEDEDDMDIESKQIELAKN